MSFQVPAKTGRVLLGSNHAKSLKFKNISSNCEKLNSVLFKIRKMDAIEHAEECLLMTCCDEPATM